MSARVATFATDAAYKTYESNEKTRLGLPVTGRNFKTKDLEPTKQATVDSTAPLPNRNAGDNRVACFIDSNAPDAGLTIITEEEARKAGFLRDITVTVDRNGNVTVKGVNNNSLTP